MKAAMDYFADWWERRGKLRRFDVGKKACGLTVFVCFGLFGRRKKSVLWVVVYFFLPTPTRGTIPLLERAPPPPPIGGEAFQWQAWFVLEWLLNLCFFVNGNYGSCCKHSVFGLERLSTLWLLMGWLGGWEVGLIRLEVSNNYLDHYLLDLNTLGLFICVISQL